MIRLTSIVRVVGGAVHSVDIRMGWMDDVDIDEYLEKTEAAEGVNVVFNKINVYSGWSNTDGGWVSAHRRNGQWDIAAGDGG